MIKTKNSLSTNLLFADIHFNHNTDWLEWYNNECIWNAIICFSVSELFAFDLTAYFLRVAIARSIEWVSVCVIADGQVAVDDKYKCQLTAALSAAKIFFGVKNNY